MQVEGETTQPSSVFRVISLERHYMAKRAPGSNLEGILRALRIFNIYSYLWNKFHLLSVHHEQENHIQHLHASPEECFSIPLGSARTSTLGEQTKARRGPPASAQRCCTYTGCRWGRSPGLHTAFSSAISSALCEHSMKHTIRNRVYCRLANIYWATSSLVSSYGHIVFPRRSWRMLVFQGRSRWEFPFYRSERQHCLRRWR